MTRIPEALKLVLFLVWIASVFAAYHFYNFEYYIYKISLFGKFLARLVN